MSLGRYYGNGSRRAHVSLVSSEYEQVPFFVQGKLYVPAILVLSGGGIGMTSTQGLLQVFSLYLYHPFFLTSRVPVGVARRFHVAKYDLAQRYFMQEFSS